MEIEEEINTSNSQNNNNINTVNEQQIVNINQDNNKGSNHLFDMLYNKDHIEEEINTNNSQNNSNINIINEQQIVNVNQDNNKSLFDVNYNKDYYDAICNNINNVSNNKQEYKIFMKMVSQVFDNIIKKIYYDINNIDKGSYEDESIKFLKEQLTIPSDILEKFAKLFDSISFIKNTRNNNYNTISQLKQHDMNTRDYIMSSK